ncbi:g3168 [Coccomyxa viridis]|uniref:Ubiquitin-like modifier-activating enzyme ATG7 n=1 Tax=Coccomyxa viridis TaxID=1274662 RepID=A0ABP1FM54_9CHLO
MAHQLLQFQQLQSTVDVAFWAELGRLKLDTLRLSEDAQPITGFYSASNSSDYPASLTLDGQSLESQAPHRKGLHSIPGSLLNVNTFERFKAAQEQASQHLQKASQQIWQDILSGRAQEDPGRLLNFLLLSYADLKHFRYYYWFAFPVLKPPEPFRCKTLASLEEGLGADLAASTAQACAGWLGGISPASASEQGAAPVWLIRVADTGVRCQPLSTWQELQGLDGRVILGIADHGNLPGNPGWLLRNSLLLAAVRFGVTELEVACIRLRRAQPCVQRSLLLSVTLPHKSEGDWASFMPTPTGWELNARGKLGPRMMNLGPSMDPRQLAESAVDLNLKLMRWRAAPALDTARLAATKCLLLGAGTLGCAVARVLLGWGIRHITFVDSGRVAYSNPVRQSLYEFKDCLEGGQPKAEAAAEALRRIFPSVQASGLQFSIPMPGHPLSDAEIPKAEADAKQLDSLMEEHDVTFLLMDTRESRWLPTLLGAAKNKLVINAALGFDSFLVLRHGAGPSGPHHSANPREKADPAGMRLGCYFCNDVVAPLDSTVDRTLEQQCTVARPGLAGIAGSLAVEVCCGALQHPQGVRAPAAQHDAAASSATGHKDAVLPLGPVPHMIRGQLGGGFAQQCLVGSAFRQCTACSWAVVEQYRQQGWKFILEALQDPHALEDLTGLTELHNAAAALMMDASEEEEDENDSLLKGNDQTSAAAGDDWTEL